ncbi:MAG: hypothetical protein CL470_07315 [Acidimicrobiaceae bacterium]|nr:hypothetical protein [Acidimicrobiaceae bacterium]|tara:strand:- start:50 stop:469 length:420 start_codon:yes stop_codon:yes gene_type:complete
MSSVFTKIINSDLPGYFVWRDEVCVSFLSINPVSPGHALIVPVMEIDHWLDLPHEVNSHLMHVAQIVGLAQMAAFNPSRVGMLIAGLEVPHTHLHVIPMQGMGDLDLSRAEVSVDHTALAATAEKLLSAIVRNGHTPEL